MKKNHPSIRLTIMLIASVVQLKTAKASVISFLPEGKHKELVVATCGSCHSIALVGQNRMDREGWLKTIRWMQKYHNLWQLPIELENQILDYLEEALSPAMNASFDGLGPKLFNPLPEKKPN